MKKRLAITWLVFVALSVLGMYVYLCIIEPFFLVIIGMIFFCGMTGWAVQAYDSN